MPRKDDRQIDGDITINNLYPDLSPEQQAEVEYRMLRYLAVIKDIFEQICQSKPEILTELERRAMLRKKRNNTHNS